MKRIALAIATSLMLATSASAGGFAYTFPTLTFAPVPDTIVAKDCLPTQSATASCSVQQ